MRLAVVCILLGVGAMSAYGATLKLESGEPGNVFLAGQDVRLRISGGEAGASATVRLVDYEGNELAAGHPDEQGRLDLGKLGRGYYELTVSQGGQKATVPVVVVPRPRLHAGSRLAVDAAHSWLIKPERFQEGAELLRRAGMAWARERLSWPEVEPQRGSFRWGKYDASADAAHPRGIRVYQIFHATPAWARADRDGKRYPDDLRDVYNFCRAAARHYQGRVQAWEVWNEADISVFSTDTGSEYAAFLKAAYLGFKAGDPKVLVTQVSMAMGAGAFEECLYKNGTPAYFDIFNYHIYAGPRDYPARARGHLDLLDRYRVPRVPVWLTEAGIPLHATDDTLTPQDKRKQAEFIPKSYVMSLASGTDRHFFFVFPHYLENGVEFGVMDADLKPYPGYSALAAVTDLLGEARYLGRLELAGAGGVEARLFDNGEGETLVIWAEGPEREVALPGSPARARLYNCVGAELPFASDGPPQLKVGPSPLYVRAPRGSFGKPVQDLLARRSPGLRPQTADRSLVLRLRPPEEALRKGLEAYELRAGEPVRVQVEVYNLGTNAAEGSVQLSAPSGWALEPAAFDVELEPMGRVVRTVTLTPPRRTSEGPLELRAQMRRMGRRNQPEEELLSTPAVVDLVLDPSSLEPADTRSLGLEDPGRWEDNVSGNGTMSHQAGPEGSVAFEVRFQGSGDRWVYPTVRYAQPQDWRGYDGLSLEIAADTEDPNTDLRVMVGETSGAVYYTEAGFPAARTWRKVYVPFNRLAPGPFAPADPNGRLDLDQVRFLRFGANTSRDRLTFRTRGLALVRYRPRNEE